MPPDSVLVVVDDASDDPVPDIRDVTVIRNERRFGVAMSKNRGIAALMDAGCDDLFLADDDIAPACPNWWRPYVDSPEPHLSYQGPRRRPKIEGGNDEKHWSVTFPRGYLLYVTRKVVDKVGGMDPAYGMWGGEHATWQRRIHDAGLTTWPYADVVGSDRLWLIYATISSVNVKDRGPILAATDAYWRKQPQFIPYREGHGMQDWSKLPVIEARTQNWPLLRHVLRLGPTGTAVEFGTGCGATTRIIAEQMPVVSFDSNLGLPEDWRKDYPRGRFAGEVPAGIPNATLVEGWFEDSLPGFDFDALGDIGLVSIDCDLYSSTKTALKYIGPYLKPGTFVYFDEMWDYPGWEDHEYKAWCEFIEDTKIGWTVVGYSPQKWAIRIS